MPRGGIHKGTLQPHWNGGKTTTIRVPIAKKDEILGIAKALDLLEGKGMVLDEACLLAAIALLKDCEKMPANKGGAIKEKIRQALALIES